ncbi:MAG: branched-chain amino acid ABC transporter permease [Actinomycetota bacterium]|nr:branched-chain amino acid ABC transporter permease [Actinomycetota bacterium]
MATDTTTETVELPAPAREAAEAAAPSAFRPSAFGWARRYAVAGGLVLFVFSLPVIVTDDAAANLIALGAIYACVALSMNVLTGYLGQLSLGHQAFYGIGAFVSASVVTNLALPFGVGLLAGALSGAVAALVLGGVALRIRGLYLAIVTLAYGLLAENSLFLIRPLTGGGAGVIANRPTGFTSNRAYAYVCLGVLALLFAFDWRLLKSKAGRAIQAIRDDEKVAASFGINITGYKLLAFVLSGIYAGLAGALFAHQLGNVVAAPFNLTLALTFVLMTVVGGLGNRVGVIIGGAFFATIDTILELIHGVVIDAAELVNVELGEGIDPVLAPVIGAALLVLTLIRAPGGIGQQISPIQNWIRGGRFDIHSMHDRSAALGGGGDGRS